MKTKQTLIAGVLTALVLSAPSALAAPAQTLVFQNLRGTMHLVQDVPCNGRVDETTTIADGLMSLTPVASGRETSGFQQFDLTRLEMLMTPSVSYTHLTLPTIYSV